MECKNITSKTVWTAFFDDMGSPSFHQSWEWGEFQRSQGYDILRLGIYEKDYLIGIALIIKIRSKRGNFLFVPHGPILNIPSERLSVTVPSSDNSRILSILKCVLDFLIVLARSEKFSFIRIAPILGKSPEHAKLFKDAGFHKAPIYIHAETMWVVDISKSEDEILTAMRKTTRYLIKKGLKDGITCETYDTKKTLDQFWKLYEKTAIREHFTPFTYKYIQNEYLSFAKNKKSQFFLGRIPPKFAQEGVSPVQAGSLIIFTKSTGFYHQGASIHTKYPVPYVLQWQAMLESKKRGCRYYNLYGIYKKGRTPRAWQGLSLFKQGFSGFEVNYLETQDYVISPLKYAISYGIDKYLALKRGIY